MSDEARKFVSTEPRIEPKGWATAGPWAASIRENGQYGGWVHSFWTRAEDDGDVVCDVFAESDAELIALAPEMAEAILAWHADAQTGSPFPAEDELLALAEKLRAIAGTDG